MGKGSKPRPISIPRKQYEQRWDQVFNIVKGMETQASKDQTERLVYSGGHHDVYCDGTMHTIRSGGYCQTGDGRQMRPRYKCDCARWASDDPFRVGGDGKPVIGRAAETAPGSGPTHTRPSLTRPCD